jgi:uncharacterized protein (TIGR03435 family)
LAAAVYYLVMRTATFLMILAGAAAQTLDASLQFEVASIRPAPPPNGRGMRIRWNGGPGTKDPGLFNCENCSPSMLVMQAYDIKDYQYSGPDWTQSTRFNISAKVPPGATKEQFRQMMQNLLAERFKMTFHREKKEMATYELVVAKNGPKMKAPAPPPADGDEKPPARPPGGFKTDANGFPVLAPGRESMGIITGSHATIRFANETMADFAGSLSDQVRKPITDATGLKGKYDFTLQWVTDGASLSSGDPGPTIFQALQDQLGLKLESKKGMVDILVVDHLEKTPTEN